MGPYLVRKPAAVSTTATTGDGKGSENPVPVMGMNKVVLLVDVNKTGFTAAADLETSMEISIDGTDYYRETSQAVSAGVATVTKKKYSVDETVISTSPADDRIAISLDVLAAFARFTFNLSAGANWSNVACRALTGRV